MDEYSFDILKTVLEQLKQYATSIGFRLIAGLIVLVIGLKLSKIFVNRIKKSKVFLRLDGSVAGFSASFLSIVLKILVFITVISILGVPTSSIVAVIASAGVAVGLAVQGAMSNLVGGMMILFFKPFKKGDFIEAKGVSGTVRDVTVFYTLVMTVDNNLVTVPNGELANSVLTNYSSEDVRRAEIRVSVGYDSDIEKVKSVIENAISDTKGVLDDPKPMVVLVDYEESAIVFSVRAWAKNSEYWDVKFMLNEKILSNLRNNGIEIPFRQIDVNIKEPRDKK